jgi:hypothetical protein
MTYEITCIPYPLFESVGLLQPNDVHTHLFAYTHIRDGKHVYDNVYRVEDSGYGVPGTWYMGNLG